MPELPDVTVYVERLNALCAGSVLERARIASPFLVRTWEPPIASIEGRRLVRAARMAKRIVLELEGDLHLVIHLMISGRLRWREKGAALPRKLGLCAFDFQHGTLIFTEASTQKRASVHLFAGRSGLESLRRTGVEPLQVAAEEFGAALRRENRTLKRALTDPDIVSGVGNAYSDEALHRARLSPVQRTQRLDDVEVAGLHRALAETLTLWTERLRAEVGDGFPDHVSAFREGMAVHGRYRQPCPDCGTAVQRIRYASNEVDYCPRCQTGGKLLADRGLSRLLKADWPRSIEELEERRAALPAPTAKPSRAVRRTKPRTP